MIFIFYSDNVQHSCIQVFTDNMDFKFRIILYIHVCFLIFILFSMHLFTVQHIDLDFRSMRYIKIDIIIL